MQIEARREFEDFVMEVFKRLCSMESSFTGIPSTLNVFCHIDVSLIFDENRKANYFVNEVERTNTASLWTSLRKQSNMTMTNDFQSALYGWVQSTRSQKFVSAYERSH